MHPLANENVSAEKISALIKIFSINNFSPGLLKAYRKDQFAKFISACKATVPHYRSLPVYKKSDLDTYLKKVPFLSKDVIKKNYFFIINREKLLFNAIGRKVTSGTTGEPLSMLYDAEWMEKQQAAFYCQLQRLIEIYHHQFAKNWNLLALSDFPSLKDTDNRMPTEHGIRFIRRKVYPDQAELEFVQFVVESNGFGPYILNAKPTTLLIYIDLLNRLKLAKLINFPLFIITSGELLLNSVRKQIEAFFSCSVYNSYAMTEFGEIGCECKNKDGLHVATDRLWIEIVGSEERSQGWGEIVITDFTNQLMPLIRYKTGDRGKIDTGLCSCGSFHPKLSIQLGRIIYYFRKKSGILFNPYSLAPYIEKLGVDRYQVRQLEDLSLNILYKKDGQDIDKEFLKDTIRSVYKSELNVKIERTDTFPDHFGVKVSNFISEIANPFF